MEAKLLLVPWLVSIFYCSIPSFWLAIHPFAERWRRMQRSPYLLLPSAGAGSAGKTSHLLGSHREI
jgi:hypothetical protein